ncbi:hypothetical protein D3C72_2260840 [compost metagenome]
MVHSGHPVVLHGEFLFLGILAAISLDLHDEMQEIVLAAAIIHQHDEVGAVDA